MDSFRKFIEAATLDQVLNAIPNDIAPVLNSMPEDNVIRIANNIAKIAPNLNLGLDQIWRNYKTLDKNLTPAEEFKITSDLWKTSTGQQQKVAPIMQRQTAQYQDLGSIDNAVKTYQSRMPGMPRIGIVRSLPDANLQTAIFNKIKSREIPVHPSELKAMEFGRGVHFYQNKKGDIGFVIN